MVKMKDVAQRAGVSIATVSNVITGKRTVSPEVQKAVLQAIEDLDYHVNMVARGLKTQRTNTIGVVLPDVTKLFFNDVLKGIMTAAAEHGYSINILSSGYDFSLEKNLIATLRGNHVDAIILDSCVDFRQAEEWGKELVAAGKDIPLVSLENKLSDGVSSICVDCFRWSNQITKHLIDQGRKKIFYISGPLSLRHEQDRLEGYKQALVEHGIEVKEDLIVTQDFQSGSAYHAVQQVLEQGVDFDAIQASNDQAAIGAIKALMEAGIEVPGKVAVTGFDNLFPSSLVSPAITTVHVHRYTMGYTAVMECIRRIGDPEAEPLQQVMDSHMVIRGSSTDQAKSEWDLDNW
jgi:DNA-binding LacI/PurR family transcriptional regulator